MKFKSLILVSGMLLFAGNASATLIECLDATNPDGSGSGSGGAVASSSITTAGATAGATVSNSNCGPWPGNDNTDLTAAAGGYGFNLFSAADLDGWVFLDKAEGADSSLITGTNWGTTAGTFSFADASYDDYLIVLKFDGVYSTFLSDSWADGWGWNTDVDGGGEFAISHLSVYVRNPSQVPEPAIVGLLSIGLLGMVVARRRMKL
jgi:hypothetical protein